MPTLAEATDSLVISNIGHVFLLPPGSEFPDIGSIVFGDESTYGSAIWLGDTSSENLPEFEEDGGDISFKRTWDRKNLRSVREDKTITGTINAVAITKDFLENTAVGGVWNEATKSYTISSNVTAKQWMMLIVVDDGINVAGYGFYNVSLLSGFPTYDLEEFTEIPVSVAVASDDQGRTYEIFAARPRGTANGDPVIVPQA
ncbi:hypothetical protein [uncultured Rothia sp.]|uniref:phage tail tube protein n=1 Tax=uncultured Rothia sp. TaxID=316088 RepID=UPI00321670D0